MPVAIRLSRKFYDRFGDDIVGELVGLLNDVDATYRDELRQQNDTNMGRLDARIDERFARMQSQLDERFARMQSQLDERFARVDQRFADMRVEFTTQLAATKESLLRWMVGLWVAQTITFVGLWLAKP